MISSQIRQNQQIYLRNMALLALFAGEIAKRRQKAIFAVGVRGEPSFFICVLNPVKYTDPDGKFAITASVAFLILAAPFLYMSLKNLSDSIYDAIESAPPSSLPSSNQQAPTAQEQANAQTDTAKQGIGGNARGAAPAQPPQPEDPKDGKNKKDYAPTQSAKDAKPLSEGEAKKFAQGKGFSGQHPEHALKDEVLGDAKGIKDKVGSHYDIYVNKTTKEAFLMDKLQKVAIPVE
jgi:hypothetical protein